MAVGMLSETTSNLDPVRERLQTERDRLNQLLGAVTGTLQMTHGDDASSAKLRSRLTDVKKALGRIEAGTYGRCVSCESEIAASLLEKSPVATKCTACEMKSRMAHI